ncbi:MAG: hypothetical protein KKI14_02650, partial [Nanoarchaeota archaeon]|nr:hypothetical protein [Nanoarchaeota archaeon]
MGALAGTITYPVKLAWRGAKFIRSMPARLLLALDGEVQVFGTKTIMKAIKSNSGFGVRRATLELMLEPFTWIPNTMARKKILNDAIANGFEATFDVDKNAGAMMEAVFKNKQKDLGITYDGKLSPAYKSLDEVKTMKIAMSLMDTNAKKAFLENVKAPPLLSETRFKFKDWAEAARGWDVWKRDGWKNIKTLRESIGNIGTRISSVGKTAGRAIRTALRKTQFDGPTMETESFMSVYFKSSDDAYRLARGRYRNLFDDADAGWFWYVSESAYGSNVPIMKKLDLIKNMAKGGSTLMTFPDGTTGKQYAVLWRYMSDNIDPEDLSKNLPFDELDDATKNALMKKAKELAGSDGLFTDDFPEDTVRKIWEIGRENYAKDGSAAIEKAGMKLYADRAVAVKWNPITQIYESKNPKILAELQDIVAGRIETKPTRALFARRAVRAVMFDYGKYKTPVTAGAWLTQKAEEETTENYEGSTDNSIVFVKKGSVVNVIPLDEKVASYGVKISRENPSWTDRTPVGFQTALFRASVINNPRYYTVSPCFGTGKAWKGIDDNGAERIFIKMTDEDKMCGGSKCTPGVIGCDPADCANYCYATTDRLFGKADNSPATATFTAAAAATTVCMAGSAYVSGGLSTKPCLMVGAAAGYTTIGTLMYNHKSDTSCTENYWGYWNWYLGSDTMDILEIMTTTGIGSFAKTAKGVKIFEKIGKGTRVAGRVGKNLLTDTSMIPQTQGDLILSWPNIGEEKYGINKEYIEENQAECIWGTPDNEEARKNIYGTDNDLGSQLS